MAVTSATGVESNDRAAQLQIVKILQKHTPADEPFRVDAVNALFHASARSSAEVLIAILDSGVDVKTCDSEGRTALFFAHDHKVTECLLYRGASVDVVDSGGKTALHHATLGRHDEAHRIVDILLQRPGVDIDRKDDAEKTARQYARENSGGRTRSRPEMSSNEKTEHVFACREYRLRDNDW